MTKVIPKSILPLIVTIKKGTLLPFTRISLTIVDDRTIKKKSKLILLYKNVCLHLNKKGNITQ